MTKTYNDLREAMELQEISLGRAGSTIYFAAEVRKDGKTLEQSIGKAKGNFNATKAAKTIEEKT